MSGFDLLNKIANWATTPSAPKKSKQDLERESIEKAASGEDSDGESAPSGTLGGRIGFPGVPKKPSK